MNEISKITLGLPLDLADENVGAFEEPWQAESFACAMLLSRGGYFRWEDWVRIFSGEIRDRPQLPQETAGEAYHRQWLAALEIVLGEHALCSVDEIDARQEEWRRSYLNTPHGQPVTLESGALDACRRDVTTHAHGDPRQPITISPAF